MHTSTLHGDVEGIDILAQLGGSDACVDGTLKVVVNDRCIRRLAVIVMFDDQTLTRKRKNARKENGIEVGLCTPEDLCSSRSGVLGRIIILAEQVLDPMCLTDRLDPASPCSGPSIVLK